MSFHKALNHLKLHKEKEGRKKATEGAKIRHYLCKLQAIIIRANDWLTTTTTTEREREQHKQKHKPHLKESQVGNRYPS